MMMKNSKNKLFDACNVYILLWSFWHIQTFFVKSSLVSLLFYIPFICMTLYYIIKVYTSYENKGVMLALCVFFSVLVIYGIAQLLLDSEKTFLMMLLWSLGPIFSFFVFAKQGLLTEEKLKRWLVFFIILAPCIFLHNRQQALELVMENRYEFEEITNNEAYLFVGLFPFVFIIRKKPILQYLFVAYLFYFIVTGLKRGAILIGAILLLWFVYISARTQPKKKKWGVLLMTLILIVIGYRFIFQYFERSDYFQNRVEVTINGYSSERDDIYNRAWDHIKNNDNVFQVVFGEGAFHTLSTIGSKAHNDWFELLIDCGFATTLLYFVYWLCFFRDWRKADKESLLYSMLGACFIFTFLRSFFSMSFSDMPLFTSIIIGYCFAKIQDNKKPVLQ